MVILAIITSEICKLEKKIENCCCLPTLIEQTRKAADYLINAPAFSDHRHMISQVEAVACVPTGEHYPVWLRIFWAAGIGCSHWKTNCSTLAQADELIELARDKKLILQVGFVERFNPAIMLWKRLSKNQCLLKLIAYILFLKRVPCGCYSGSDDSIST